MIKKLNSENFAHEVIDNDGKVLVDFYADWCGPCKMVAPILDEIAREHSEITVGKVNVDECADLAIRYRVASIPTLILFDKGAVSALKIGFSDKETILEMIS
ncbi:MAG: thioredoxin [Clostridia bacterium]|nr:thioredoxin [Clostridia bacterium]